MDEKIRHIRLLTAAFVLLFIAECLRSEWTRMYGGTYSEALGRQVVPGMLDDTRMYSPITMNREWSSLARLVFLVIASIFGATVNAYYISSFFVNRHLNRVGYVYQACAGLADMLISGVVIPLAAVVLLSGVWDISPVCHALQTVVAWSTYCYSMYYPLVSGVTYFRVCHSRRIFNRKMKIRITVLAISIFVMGFTLAATGTYWELDYDYCQRLHTGNYYFRLTTTLVVHGTSFFITTYTLIASSIRVSAQKYKLVPRYRRSVQFYRDSSMITINFVVYGLYVGCWLPYVIVVNKYPDASDSLYYTLACIGIGRTIVTYILYGTCNHLFRQAYKNLFKYCYCKTSLDTYQRRPRRNNEHFARPANVRIHIMQQAVNLNVPQRAIAATRETIHL